MGCAPILSQAANGDLSRVQYHEIYRAPLTLSYDTFGNWYKAFNKWYELVHSEEFKRHAKVEKGQLLICNNWRSLHGRAGLKGKARIILGGTVTRDAVYSAGRLAISRAYASLTCIAVLRFRCCPTSRSAGNLSPMSYCGR